MALKFILDSLDGLSEAQQALYVEKDGKFHLDVDGLEDTSGLKSALDKERAARRDFEKKYGALKDIDPEEYARLKKDAEERAAAKAKEEGQWEVLRQQLVDKHQKEIEGKDSALASMRVALESHLVDAAATSAIAVAKGIPDLLLPHVKASVKVVEDGGKYVVQIVDAQGNARIADGKGTPMSITDLVAEMKKSPVFGRAFDGVDTTGGGTTQPSGPGNPKIISKNDPVAFGQNLEAIAKGDMTVV